MTTQVRLDWTIQEGCEFVKKGIWLFWHSLKLFGHYSIPVNYWDRNLHIESVYRLVAPCMAVLSGLTLANHFSTQKRDIFVIKHQAWSAGIQPLCNNHFSVIIAPCSWQAIRSLWAALLSGLSMSFRRSALEVRAQISSFGNLEINSHNTPVDLLLLRSKVSPEIYFNQRTRKTNSNWFFTKKFFCDFSKDEPSIKLLISIYPANSFSCLLTAIWGSFSPSLASMNKVFEKKPFLAKKSPVKLGISNLKKHLFKFSTARRNNT